jgi:hypothetical protein
MHQDYHSLYVVNPTTPTADLAHRSGEMLMQSIFQENHAPCSMHRYPERRMKKVKRRINAPETLRFWGTIRSGLAFFPTMKSEAKLTLTPPVRLYALHF